MFTSPKDRLLEWRKRAAPKTHPTNLIFDAVMPLAVDTEELHRRLLQLERSAAHRTGEKPE